MTEVVLPILIAGLLPIACAATAKWGFKGYDNHNPRAWLAAQEGFRARANAAQQNSFEAFPLFAVGMLLAKLYGVSEATLAVSGWLFVGFRVAYIGCYLADLALLRSIVWTAAWVVVVRLYVLAML